MLVVNPAYKAVTEAWFDPAHWGTRAKPVSAGGRGSAWFLETDQGDMVLRHYRRGGLVARISERSYIFTGRRRTRSCQEFHLLKTLHDRGLPVPEPVAAWWGERRGLWYQAAILVRRIDCAVPLPEAPKLAYAALWHQLGGMIRRFHDAGLDHVDLNCDNILVAGGELYLIDLDRCRLRVGSDEAAWKADNLQRLRRSVEKRVVQVTEPQRNSLWEYLCEGYHRRPLSGSLAGQDYL
ncbi:3-deoxy-D-manno-octulosonic acid kinase [Marinobacter lacisalsi]|uniref:3-deoxy-D-manno-octulosonic acid kinase n=1 Tax=Marinobacter lacisalsi TaxID=475979 RepID=A0ABV8QHA8_9GAMM